jgi:SAM-dependent methyltransferase
MDSPRFDDLAEIYEAMIDWPKRLANEEPFYRRLFGRIDARRVLDAACGGGRHAAMFHSWGLQVEGADLSPGMLARARALYGEPAGLHWTERSFSAAIEPREPFDAVVCVGNSLALASDWAEVEQALACMLAAIRRGGMLVVQVLNVWRLPEGPCQWQRIRRATFGSAEVLIAKGVHRSGSRGYVDLLVVDLDAVGRTHSESIPFLGLEAAELEQAAVRAGAKGLQFFGGYQDQPYDRAASTDLVLIAQKS